MSIVAYATKVELLEADMQMCIRDSSRSEQTLIEGEQSLVYFKDIVVFILDEILNDDDIAIDKHS